MYYWYVKVWTLNMRQPNFSDVFPPSCIRNNTGIIQTFKHIHIFDINTRAWSGGWYANPCYICLLQDLSRFLENCFLYTIKKPTKALTDHYYHCYENNFFWKDLCNPIFEWSRWLISLMLLCLNGSESLHSYSNLWKTIQRGKAVLAAIGWFMFFACYSLTHIFCYFALFN